MQASWPLISIPTIMYSFLRQFYSGHPTLFWSAIFLAFGTMMAGIGLMATSGFLISKASQVPMIIDLFVITAAVRFFGISRAVLRYLERIVAHDVTFRVLLKVRVWFFERISGKPLHWIMGKRSGDLLARAITDIEGLQNAFLRVASPACVAFLVSLTTFVLLLTVDYSIAFSTLFFLALSGVAHSWFARKVSMGRGKTETALSTQLKSLLVDRLQGLPEVLWLGQKHATIAQTYELQDQLDQVQKKNASLTGLNDGLSSLISHLGMFSALLLAIPAVLAGSLQGAMLAMVTLGVLSSFEAVQHLANAFHHNEKTAEASARLLEITSPSAQKQMTSAECKPPDTGIAFEKVSFSYLEDYITLNNISLWFAKGSKNAVVGPSGSGKSTLINLLLNLWHSDSGSIFLNGRRISAYSPEDLRSHFAIMVQDHYVFSRTIRDNLLIYNHNATDKQIEEALKSTGLIEIDLNTKQPEFSAANISGGERQLLAFTGVILKEAPCWILDEPSAHLDAITERKLLDLVWSQIGSKTLLLITHRLVDMEKMDQIIVMDRGEIVERGTHAELLENNQLYAKMYEMQNQLL